MKIFGRRLEFLRLFLLLTSSTLANSETASAVIEELLSTTRYNSRVRPQSEKDEPLDVYININVNDISSVSEINMEFSMTLYLRAIWRDERLAYAKGHNYNRSITLNYRDLDRIWIPDIFFRNLKEGKFHTITVPNRLIRLSPDGTILYSQRLTLTLACDMWFQKYPMDNQTCKIELGSYGYTSQDIIFHWRADAMAVEMNSQLMLPEYYIQGVSHQVCSKKLPSIGSFPCLRAYFFLERRLRAYVLSTYLPSLLIVLLSWVSFWIDLESVQARISLGILTVLTISIQSSGQGRFPAVSFTKAIDVWMVACLVFVFGAFIEYSIVNVLARRAKAANVESDELHHPKQGRQFCGHNIKDAVMVDVVSRIIFPIMFLIFNMIYWPLYLL